MTGQTRLTARTRWPMCARFAVATLIATASTPAFADQHCVVCETPAATYLCEAQNGPGILAANGRQLACITELAKRGGHDSCSIMRKGAAQCAGLEPTVLYPGTGDADVAAEVDGPVSPAPASANPAVTTTAPTGPGHHPSSPNDGVATSATDTFTAVDDIAPGDGRPAAETADAKPEPEPRGPPKTVAEMAGRALEDSKKGLGKAGKAVGDTAKSAGNVVTDTAKKTGKAVGNAASKTWKCLTTLFSDC